MSLGLQLRRRARFAIVPLLCAGVLTYFGYHAVQGERGLSAWLQLDQEIMRAEAQLMVNQAELSRLERRVALLRGDGLSRDMLEERARDVLGLVHQDEIVILGH